VSPAALALLLAAAPLQVGVTLHPVYSWAAQVASGLPVEVRPVLPAEVDVGSYRPAAADVAALAHLDVLLINGLGHDDVILPMLAASGSRICRVVRLNEGTALLKSFHGDGPNPHTFLSFTNAIQQSYLLARVLGELRPELGPGLQRNASAFAARLRAQRARALQRLGPARTRRVVTVHDGYGYLLQELELTLVDVLEPAHGLQPSAAELGALLRRLDQEPVKVVLAEERFPPALREVLEAHGARVVVVSHIATGAFTADRFEQELQRSVDAIAEALGAPP